MRKLSRSSTQPGHPCRKNQSPPGSGATNMLRPNENIMSRASRSPRVRTSDIRQWRTTSSSADFSFEWHDDGHPHGGARIPTLGRRAHRGGEILLRSSPTRAPHCMKSRGGENPIHHATRNHSPPSSRPLSIEARSHGSRSLRRQSRDPGYLACDRHLPRAGSTYGRLPRPRPADVRVKPGTP